MANSRGHQEHAPPPSVHIISFSCSFRQKFAHNRLTPLPLGNPGPVTELPPYLAHGNRTKLLPQCVHQLVQINLTDSNMLVTHNDLAWKKICFASDIFGSFVLHSYFAEFEAPFGRSSVMSGCVVELRRYFRRNNNH